MAAGGIAHRKDPVRVEEKGVRLGENPAADPDAVLKGCRKRVFRREPVGVVDDGEAFGGQLHSVELIDFLCAVDPGASVDDQDHRKLFSEGIPGPVDVQHVPFRIFSVADAVIPTDVGRRRQSGIALRVSGAEFGSQSFTDFRHADFSPFRMKNPGASGPSSSKTTVNAFHYIIIRANRLRFPRFGFFH